MITDVMQKKLYRILLLITLLCLVVSMLDSCEKEVQNKNLLSNISSLDISNQIFKTEIKDNGDKINSQES